MNSEVRPSRISEITLQEQLWKFLRIEDSKIRFESQGYARGENFARICVKINVFRRSKHPIFASSKPIFFVSNWSLNSWRV